MYAADAPDTPVDLDDRRRLVADGTASSDALVVCLDDVGYRIAVPGSLTVSADRRLPVPPDRSTLLDVVLPSEQRVVLNAWHTALKAGASTCRVHFRHDGARLALVFVDAREDHGAFLVFMSPCAPDPDDPHPLQGSAPQVALVEMRPRTATTRKTRRGIFLEVDDRAVRMLDLHAHELIGQPSLDVIHPDDHPRAISGWMDTLATTQTSRSRVRHRRGDGSWLWVEAENEPVLDEAGEVSEVITRLRDITEEMEVVERLEHSERMFRRLADALPIGLVRLDRDRTIEYANDIARGLLGARTGASREEQLVDVAPDDRPGLADAIDAVMNAGAVRHLEIRIDRPGVARRLLSLTLIPLGGEGDVESGLMGCITDITESSRLREELERRATVDALTGCANRDAVMTFLADQMRGGPPVGAIFIDVDKFKPINDSLGHAAGDEVLVHVASTLRSLVRSGDLVGRLGGDEFLVVLPTRRGDGSRIGAAADRISAALTGPLVLSSGVVDIGVSVGAVVSGSCETPDELTARADAAMYRCKNALDHRPVVDLAG